MSITYEQIENALSVHNMSPHRIIHIRNINGLTEREITAIQVFAPSILKDECLDFVRTLFQGNGLNISYYKERINIEIPVKVFDPINN